MSWGENDIQKGARETSVLSAPSLLLPGQGGKPSSHHQNDGCSQGPSELTKYFKLPWIYPELLTAPWCRAGTAEDHSLYWRAAQAMACSSASRLPAKGQTSNGADRQQDALTWVSRQAVLPLPGRLAAFCRKRNPSPCPLGEEARPPAHAGPLPQGRAPAPDQWGGPATRPSSSKSWTPHCRHLSPSANQTGHVKSPRWSLPSPCARQHHQEGLCPEPSPVPSARWPAAPHSRPHLRPFPHLRYSFPASHFQAYPYTMSSIQDGLLKKKSP